MGAFFYGYMFVFHVLGGLVAERYGIKWTLGVAILLSSSLTLLTPLVAHGFLLLILVRILTGISQVCTKAKKN